MNLVLEGKFLLVELSESALELIHDLVNFSVLLINDFLEMLCVIAFNQSGSLIHNLCIFILVFENSFLQFIIWLDGR